ncbi:MAG: hypothetical protein AAGM84_01695 [Pseudomonadota bacterium]
MSAEPAAPTKAPAPSPAPSPEVGQQPVAQQVGYLEEKGAFVLPLGAGVELAAEVLGTGKTAEIPLDKIPDIPGLRLETAKFNRKSTSAMVTLAGKTNVPLTEEASFTLKFKKDGKPSGFKLKSKLALDWMDRPGLTFEWSPEGAMKAEVTVKADKFVPKAVRKKAKAEGDLTLTLADGKFTGAVNTSVEIPDVVDGKFEGAFGADGPSAKLSLTNRVDWIGDLKGEGAIGADGALSAKIEAAAGQFATPIKSLQFLGGALSVNWGNDGTLGGALTDIKMKYSALADTTASFTLDGSGYSGSADLNLNLPALSEAKGSIKMEKGKLSGSFSLGAEHFPEGLPLKSGKISGTISDTGAMSFAGSVGVALGPAGTGQLTAAFSEEGAFSMGAEVDLVVPGLQTAKIQIGFDGGTGDLSGEGELAVDPALLSGIEGAVKVSFAEGRWSGETTLGYSADNGKLSGQITVRVAQKEDDSLAVSGEGQVTAKIAPRLEGTLNAKIKEEGGIDVSGEIVVTEPLEMFPEARFEKEILDISSKIPLWAILVAVLRVRAGVRAGIGPGVFRNIKVTGSYTIGEEGEPSFAITGEMFIPAFVEGYVGFGAGLGVSVVLGSLTGGIEAMGTAGIYGAISVVPELAYKDGDYSIEGVATMAAGARLKLSLNAWAEVEALWVTVWENTWELASVTMPMGPDLGMQAKMAYTFGKPDPPSLDFSTSDIDTDKLITDAMPKDGPPKAGVKDAVKNEAKWQGAQRAKAKDADKVPPDLAKQGEKAPPVAKPAGGKPPKGKGAPPPGKAPPKDNAQTGKATDPKDAEKASKDAAKKDPAASGTVADKDAASTRTPRHGKLSMATLDEPPVPMPRTKAQQKEDVAAAAKMVKICAAQGETTDALDDYFPRIKKRFALGSIGYEFKKDGRVTVRLKVNSDAETPIDEVLQNLMDDNQGKLDRNPPRTAQIKYKDAQGNDKTEEAAVGMTIEMLTHKHPPGSKPKASALEDIFKVLETKGETGSHQYIKGHLLNEGLGGPGTAENLYPITTDANQEHKTKAENLIEDMVNTQLYFVRYEVDIKQVGPTAYYTHPVKGGIYNIVNSDMHVQAWLLDTTGQKAGKIVNSVVASRFNASNAAGDLVDLGEANTDDTPVEAKGIDRSGFGTKGTSTTKLKLLASAHEKMEKNKSLPDGQKIALTTDEQDAVNRSAADEFEKPEDAQGLLNIRAAQKAAFDAKKPAANTAARANFTQTGGTFDPISGKVKDAGATIDAIKARNEADAPVDALGKRIRVAQHSETYDGAAPHVVRGTTGVTPLVLTPTAVQALTLFGARELNDLPLSDTDITPQSKLSDFIVSQKIGMTSISDLHAVAGKAVAAAAQKSNIAADLSTAERAPLYTFNKGARAANLLAAMNSFNGKADAYALYLSNRCAMKTEKDKFTTIHNGLEHLIAGFNDAPYPDRRAVAEKVKEFVKEQDDLTQKRVKEYLKSSGAIKGDMNSTLHAVL